MSLCQELGVYAGDRRTKEGHGKRSWICRVLGGIWPVTLLTLERIECEV